MKALLLLLTALVPFLAVSCSNGTDDDDPGVVYAVAYIVESTGANATVTQIDYVDTNGADITVMNPTLPWSATLSRFPGQTAHLVVAGTTGATSEITGTIQDDPLLIMTPAIYATATCPENTDPCAIDITHTF